MLDIDLEEDLVQKVGGKFALTYLLQRRMVELNRGDRPLVELDGEEVDNRRIACQEILEGKITLVPLKELIRDQEEREEKKKIEAEATKAEKAPEEEQAVYGSDIKKIKEQRIKELSQLLNPNKR
ncbi:MAG: DNA-directed RNA polymerase subunit omega [Planctomycetota bacterium]